MAESKKAKTYTAEEIKALVEDKEKTTEFTDLRDQFDTDFDLFTLEAYQGKAGHQSYTSPAPKNDFLKVFHGVNKAQLTWQIVVADDAPQEERDSANKGENILSGIIAQADRRQRNAGEPSIRESAAWFACGRGVLGMRCLIYSTKKDDKNKTEIDIRPIDVMNLTWEMGRDGPVWAAIKYQVSAAEAKSRWDVELEDTKELATVIDFFNESINAVVLSEGGTVGGKSQFVKEPEEHGLDHVPIYVGFAGSMPTIFTSDKKSTLKYRAASVWNSSRSIYEPMNKQISFVMDTAEKSVAGTLIHASPDGSKTIKGDPFGTYQVINTVFNAETITALEPPKVPPESALIMGILDKDKQASTIPYPIGYGLDPSAHSGAALAMMNDNIRSVYGPFSSLVEDAFRWLCEEILSQFKKKGQKITLKGYNNKEEFFVLDANPDDIKDEWYVVVKCEPKLPRDEQAEMQVALMATTPRGPTDRPFLSDQTAREKIIHLQNPDAEEIRIDEQTIRQMIAAMPNIQVRKVADELRKKGDLQGAMELLSSLPNPMASGGGMSGQPSGPPEGAMPAGGQPMAPGGQGGVPMPTAQEIPQILAYAESLLKQGKPLPPELQMVLQRMQQAGVGMPPVR